MRDRESLPIWMVVRINPNQGFISPRISDQHAREIIWRVCFHYFNVQGFRDFLDIYRCRAYFLTLEEILHHATNVFSSNEWHVSPSFFRGIDRGLNPLTFIFRHSFQKVFKGKRRVFILFLLS